jgi:hypothetical protein
MIFSISSFPKLYNEDSTIIDKIFFWIIVCIEIVLFFYAISFAIKCTNSISEQFIHSIFAAVFTIPYVFLQTLFSPDTCKRKIFNY